MNEDVHSLYISSGGTRCGCFTSRVDVLLVMWMFYLCGCFTSRVDVLLVVWMFY